jgi:hemerythrin-like domain-containing protein
MSSACTCTCRTTGNPDAVEFLKEEHRVIERVLDAIEHELAQRGVTPAFMWPALEFLAAFADGCHHHKEEEHLFPALEERGVPRDGGPIGCMLSEHDAGRALMKRMRSSLVAIETGQSKAECDFRSAAARYIEHLREHIAKEDDVLFVMAQRLLSPTQRAQMARRFYDFERSGDRTGTHDRYVALAETLERRAFGEVHDAAKGCSHAGCL